MGQMQRIFIFLPANADDDPAAFEDGAQAHRYAALVGGYVRETFVKDRAEAAERIADLAPQDETRSSI